MKKFTILLTLTLIIFLASCANTNNCVNGKCFNDINSEGVLEFLGENDISGTEADVSEITKALQYLEKYRRWYSIESQFAIHFLHYNLQHYVDSSVKENWIELYTALSNRNITETFAIYNTLSSNAYYQINDRDYVVYKNNFGDVTFTTKDTNFYVGSIDSDTGLIYTLNDKENLIQRSPENIVDLQADIFDNDELDINLEGDYLTVEIRPNNPGDFIYGYFIYNLDTQVMLSIEIDKSKVIVTIIKENVYKDLKSSLIDEFEVSDLESFLEDYTNFIIEGTLMEEEINYLDEIYELMEEIK